MIKHLVKKHSKKFSLFFIIGMFKVVWIVGLNWLLIDILLIRALIGSTITTTSVFFIILAAVSSTYASSDVVVLRK